MLLWRLIISRPAKRGGRASAAILSQSEKRHGGRTNSKLVNPALPRAGSPFRAEWRTGHESRTGHHGELKVSTASQGFCVVAAIF